MTPIQNHFLNVSSTTTTITYTYDPLYRLSAATYSNGLAFAYAYDAVGNRLTQTTITNTTVYTYDNANRLTNVGAITYTWDANGNLLSDGVYTYTYDTANRLVTVKQGTTLTYTFGYDGLGDRLRQTINGITTTYALNLNSGLTQVLADSTNTYLYGNGRIAQYAGTTPSYFLSDALGSVRQLANASGAVTLARSYEPFGNTLSSVGSGTTVFQFTGEQRDATGLTYLRARYLSTQVGRFITRDTWPGDYQRPMSFNAWLYAYANLINLTDPSGHDPWWGEGCYNNQAQFGYRYCILHRGGFIDVVHFNGARNYAGVSDLFSLWYFVYSNRTNSVQHIYTHTQTFVGGFLPFSQAYRVEHLNELSDYQLKGVAISIYMDYQFMFETLQTLPVSAFSNEDLPTDYLGFFAGMEGKDLEWAVSELGGGYPSSQKPSGYGVTAFEQWRDCVIWGYCDDSNPLNNQWTLKIRKVCDNGDIRYINTPWPKSLSLDPVSSGWYWSRYFSPPPPVHRS